MGCLAGSGDLSSVISADGCKCVKKIILRLLIILMHYELQYLVLWLQVCCLACVVVVICCLNMVLGGQKSNVNYFGITLVG